MKNLTTHRGKRSDVELRRFLHMYDFKVSGILLPLRASQETDF